MQSVRGARSSIGAIRRVPSQARKQISGIRPPKTWEGWAILALLVAALVTRLWDLGGRALHYDEILHAWYSWLYAEGGGYAHNPLTHGPLLYHVGAATYNTIGSSEFAARLAPALFGAALVVMPWLFRKELGRYGALTASLFLLASPTVLYFARFMRNDIYMAVWAVALLAVALRYMERPRPWMLFAWAVLWALTFASKESAFFLVGMFGLLLLARSAPALVQWVRNVRPLSQAGPAADLLIVMGTLTLPMWAPIFGLVQDAFGIILVNPDGNHPLVQSGELFRADEPTGAPVGGAKYIAGFIVLALAAISVTIGMTWNRRRWPLLFGTFAAAWLLLFTSLFSNWQGFFTGIWGSMGYWIAQQGVERANQPWYYYMIGLSVYEFAIAIPALIGSVYLLARRRNTFDIAIVGWAWLSFAVYSYAGERMPWLLTGIAVPCAFVAGRVAGILTEQIAVRGASLARVLPAGLALGILVLALGMTVFISARASYSYEGFERPRELLVYSQTGQETPYALECIERFAASAGLGRGDLRILTDEHDNFAWQWRWYLRDYPWITYRTLNTDPVTEPPDDHLVMMSIWSEDANKEQLVADYTRLGELHTLWWYPNYAYDNLTPADVFNGATSSEGWQLVVDYQLRREVGSEMQYARGAIYVRNDLVQHTQGCQSFLNVQSRDDMATG